VPLLLEVGQLLLAAEQRLHVGVVHGDAPREQDREQEVVERLPEIAAAPLLIRIDAHNLVTEILVLGRRYTCGG
jgi:hypothetical protein